MNLLGICQGGTFSLCFSALHPDRVKNLIVMVTPVDFHAGNNVLSHWGRNIDVDLLVDTLGNVPGELLNFVFLSLRPYRLTGQKYIDVVNVLDDEEQVKNFVRMEKWIFDSPDQAGEAFRQFVRDFFQKNGLMRGEVEIGGQRVELGNVTMPVMNIFATEDHLVPPDASKALRTLVGSQDYQEVSFRGGHIGIYVSGRAQRDIPAAINSWLRARAA
ncbi:MAG: alpha/beta fold hydrolase [Defluviicoccus sp.]